MGAAATTACRERSRRRRSPDPIRNCGSCRRPARANRSGSASSSRRAGPGSNDRLALFEWSAGAELDPSDVEAWESANPALGETITADELANAYASATTPDSRAEFERAHLNRWTANVEAILPAELWRAARAPELLIGPELVIGFDVALDRSQASIVAAGVAGERVIVELVACRPGRRLARAGAGRAPPALVAALDRGERFGPGPIGGRGAGGRRRARRGVQRGPVRRGVSGVLRSRRSRAGSRTGARSSSTRRLGWSAGGSSASRGRSVER